VKPIPKKSPELTRNQYYMAAAREFAKVVVDSFKASTGRQDMPRFDAKVILEVDITFLFPNRSDILGTADVDHSAKFVLDAFNKVALHDDRQVVSLSPRKNVGSCCWFAGMDTCKHCKTSSALEYF
jgi:Holliday junction resolvase RusA-like endonuclease